jgi:phosphatidylethanolamine/phosphatidyl-N-methylethanolamine N-methyltransferase
MSEVILASRKHVRAYDFWAHVYDLLFHGMLDSGRRAAVQVVRRSGTRVLDVGVGTGLALSYFLPNQRVVGIDLSEAMLEKARMKVDEQNIAAVEALLHMDATQIAFENECFDGVVAEYVVTLIPDYSRALDEFVRVVRPGGDIVFINYFADESGPKAWFDWVYGLFVKALGLTTRFPYSRIERWLGERKDVVELIEKRGFGFLGMYTLVHLRRKI